MSKHRHFIIHKPYGHLSQFVTRQTKRPKPMLGELYDFPKGTMAIGRLDVKSEGLLLLTTDGKVSDFITSSKVDKEYYVQLDGAITEEAIAKLRSGVEIGFDGKKYRTQPCEVTIISPPNIADRKQKIRDARHGPTSWISIILREGKFRQVRKMTSGVGFPTLRLVRVRIGTILLNQIPSGGVVEVDRLL